MVVLVVTTRRSIAAWVYRYLQISPRIMVATRATHPRANQMQDVRLPHAEFATIRKRTGRRALPRVRIVMRSVMRITRRASDSRVLTVTNLPRPRHRRDRSVHPRQPNILRQPAGRHASRVTTASGLSAATSLLRTARDVIPVQPFVCHSERRRKKLTGLTTAN